MLDQLTSGSSPELVCRIPIGQEVDYQLPTKEKVQVIFFAISRVQLVQ